jgi:hypothetical protein
MTKEEIYTKSLEKIHIENALLEAIYISRWTENGQGLYAVLEADEAFQIINDIYIELNKIGYKICKKE